MKKHKVKIFWLLLIAVIFLGGLIGYLSLREFSIFEGRTDPEKFMINEECSLVMGNVLHPMKNDADCKIRCRGECDVRGMDFFNHSFIEKEGSCHTCECFCN